MTRKHDQPFCGLPRELRDMVWRELLTHKDIKYRKRKTLVAGTDSATFMSRPDDIANLSPDPIHLRVFLTSKRTYLETSPIFYSSNIFITDTENLSTLKSFEANIKHGTRHVHLESKQRRQILFEHSNSNSCTLNLSFVGYRLDMVTIKMPVEPLSGKVLNSDKHGVITAPLAIDLVDCMMKGVIKRLRLIYPKATRHHFPEKFFTLLILRLGRAAVSGDHAINLQKSWSLNNDNGKGFRDTFIKLAHAPRQKFIARFEDGRLLRRPGQPAVIVLSRREDEPAVKETVPRPRLNVVSRNTHTKRKHPCGVTRVHSVPTKFPRLQLPTFLAFSESREHKMSSREAEDRWIGKMSQLRRIIKEKGSPLVQISQEKYRWVQHSNQNT